jgi:hypothetical protein
VLRHRFPGKGPDQRRRAAAGFAAGRTPVEISPPSVAVNAVSPLSLPGLWARATAPFPAVAPSQLGQLGRKRARALAPSGPKSPPLAQLARNTFSFFFSHFFSPFSHICLYAEILCTKNSLNKL